MFSNPQAKLIVSSLNRPVMPCASLAHGGAWRDLMLGDSGSAQAGKGQVMLCGPVPSSLHCHRPRHSYNALGLSQLVIAYGGK